MVSSFLIAILFFVNSKLETPWFEIASHWQLVIGVIITTIAWVSVTLLTQPSDQKTLDKFEELVFSEGKFKHINYKIGAFLLGTLGVYASLFGTGFIIYGDYLEAGISFVIALIGFLYLVKNWNKIV